jgi:hypothetical protein
MLRNADGSYTLSPDEKSNLRNLAVAAVLGEDVSNLIHDFYIDSGYPEHAVGAVDAFKNMRDIMYMVTVRQQYHIVQSFKQL